MMDADNGFRVLDENTMIQYIKATPVLMAKLGNQLEGLKIKEIGDGAVNYVYTVVGVDGSFVVKQAPPYMRSLGESYPMSPERAYFEALGLKELGRLCPNHVPEVYHFNKTMSLIAMQYIEPPHIGLRKGLLAGIEYPLFAEHMSEYLARTLYFTSLLFHSTPEHKRSDRSLKYFLAVAQRFLAVAQLQSECLAAAQLQSECLSALTHLQGRSPKVGRPPRGFGRPPALQMRGFSHVRPKKYLKRLSSPKTKSRQLEKHAKGISRVSKHLLGDSVREISVSAIVTKVRV